MNRATRQQHVIFETIQSAGRPLSPSEILERGKQECPSLGIATVYRGIKRLLEEAHIAQVSLPGKTPYFEDAKVAAHHHHHFQCDSCGHVYDIEGCSEKLRNLIPRGFTLRSHDLILYGQCDSCSPSK